MRFLITGGAGFIGSHLAERLVARGERVTVLDNLSTGSLENIAHLVDTGAVDFHFGSIQERDTVERLIGESDFVVHFAAALGVKLILEKPVESMETNVTGTHVVLEAAARNRTPVLIASTSEVYGKSNKIPFCEDDDVVLGATRKSRWSYTASKMLDEFLASRLLGIKTPAGDCRAFLQYGWAQAERALRHGASDVCAAGARRRPNHHPWRRQTNALLLRRPRYGGSGYPADRRAGLRRSL
jgi:nucleoside-diphosphate-sugar epimerase